MPAGSQPSNLPLFIKAITARAQVVGAIDLFISTKVDAGGVQRPFNMLMEWAAVETDQVQTEARATRIRIGADLATEPAKYRRCQNNEIMSESISVSVNEDVAKVLALHTDAYTFVLPSGITVRDAPTLLCVLISITDTKTKATAFQTFQRLQELPAILKNHKWNIPVFHVHVRQLKDIITSHGMMAPDLVYGLIAAYQLVPDEIFNQYINRLMTDFEEGKVVNEATLMLSVETKYHSRQRAGTWCEGERDSTLVALNTRIQALEDRRRQGGGTRGGGGRTESEYISLSEAAKSTICLMNLLEEAIARGIPIKMKPADVHCKLFEDNSGAYEMATTPKFRPRTKHLNVRYHFFRSYVESGKLNVVPVASDDNISDMLTKPAVKELFLKFRYRLIGF